MKPTKIIKIRRDIAKDLMDFQSCLNGIIDDSTPITKAITSLRNDSDITRHTWKYSIDDLSLVINNVDYKHIRPKDVQENNDIKVSMTISVDGNCAIWDGDSEICSFNELSYKVKIAHKSDLYQTAFHLDICQPAESISGEAHPTFHLQYKPNVDNLDDFDYGQVLELDIPRISHPPMELILGIDFLFSNFAPAIWQKLHENGTYLNLLRKYQLMIWQPYYLRISNFWGMQFGEINDNWHPQALLPNLINRND